MYSQFMMHGQKNIKLQHFVFSTFFSRKSCQSWDNVEERGTDRQVTGVNIMRRS